MLRILKTEQCKLKHSSIWLAVLGLPLIPAFLGSANYAGNTGILNNQWYSLWTQVTLFYCYFFFPALIGIYCAYLFRLEHMNHNWNLLMTMPIKSSSLFLGKWLTAGGLILITQLFLVLLYFLAGTFLGLTAPFPWKDIMLWSLLGTGAGCAIAAFLLLCSLIIRSFAVPVAIAFAGGIMGMGLYLKGLGLLSPFSLLALGMNANTPSGELPYSPLVILGGSLAFSVLFCFIGILWLKIKDVKSE